MSGRRRGQAVVEVLALAPVLVALLAAFVIARARLVAQARAEAVLADVQAADAAGTPPAAALLGRARLVLLTPTVVRIAVAAPLGDVRLAATCQSADIDAESERFAARGCGRRSRCAKLTMLCRVTAGCLARVMACRG